MSASPHIIEFDYVRMSNADAVHVYGCLLGVYSGITLGMLQRSVRAFRFSYDEFLTRFRLQLDGRVTDEVRGLDIRRADLLAELSRLISAGVAGEDPAVRTAARRVGRVLAAAGALSPLAPDARTCAVTGILAGLTEPRTAPFLGRLAPARTLVRQLAEANGAYARLYDACVTSADIREASVTADLRAEADDDARAMAAKVNSCIDILGDAALVETAGAANAVLADAIREADYCLAPPCAEADGTDGGGDAPEPAPPVRRRVKNRRIRERSEQRVESSE